MAKDNPNRHVVPARSGGWDVKKPDGARASAHTATQAEAVARARLIVANNGGGEVRVHGRDGRIRRADTILPDKNPTPPRDAR